MLTSIKHSLLPNYFKFWCQYLISRSKNKTLHHQPQSVRLIFDTVVQYISLAKSSPFIVSDLGLNERKRVETIKFGSSQEEKLRKLDCFLCPQGRRSSGGWGGGGVRLVRRNNKKKKTEIKLLLLRVIAVIPESFLSTE